MKKIQTAFLQKEIFSIFLPGPQIIIGEFMVITRAIMVIE